MLQKYLLWINGKEQQERRLKLKLPKIVSASSPLHVQTGNDVIVFVILIYLITSYCRHAEITSSTYIVLLTQGMPGKLNKGVMGKMSWGNLIKRSLGNLIKMSWGNLIKMSLIKMSWGNCEVAGYGCIYTEFFTLSINDHFMQRKLYICCRRLSKFVIMLLYFM